MCIEDTERGRNMTIRELRKGKGLTQAKLGKLLGVSSKTIAAYENGRANPSDSVAARIWELYGIDIETEMKPAASQKKPAKKTTPNGSAPPRKNSQRNGNKWPRLEIATRLRLTIRNLGVKNTISYGISFLN